MMTAESMSSKRPVLRFTVALFFLLKLKHSFCNLSSISWLQLDHFQGRIPETFTRWLLIEKRLILQSSGYAFSRVTIFSLRKGRTGSLRVVMSANVHFSAQKKVKVKTNKGGHHVRRCPFFCPQNKWKPKKRLSRPQAVVCTETFHNFSWKNDFTCFYCS